MTSEMLADMGDVGKPKWEDGWRTIAELAAASKGMTEVMVRHSLKNLVATGKYERIDVKGFAYFRKKVKGQDETKT